MGLSLIELHNALEAKGGDLGSYTSLQNLKTLLNNLGSVRTTTYPVDAGQDIVGAVTCTAHDPTKFPYADGLSLGQVSDWSAYLKQMTCDNNLRVVSYCTSRTDYTCTSRTARVCECYAQGHCSCLSRTACDCNPRTTCYMCGSRTGTICECNAQIDCSCNTRTACDCNGRTNCYCDSRCGCNTEDSYA
jgi:hypothetical protein